jgi:hypothetical protein
MRSNTTRVVTTLGIALALALTGIAQSPAAPTRVRHVASAETTQPDTNNNLPGYAARPNGMCWTREGGGGHDLSGFWGPCPATAAAAPATAASGRTAHARVTREDAETHVASGDNGSMAVTGYSARPAGMCWQSEGGGGHDLSGSWQRCTSH